MRCPDSQKYKTISFKVTFDVADASVEKYAAAIEAESINGIADGTSVTYKTTITGDGKFGEFTVDGNSITMGENFVGFGNITKPTSGVQFTIPIYFDWGRDFNYIHPIDYYNDFGAEDTVSASDSTKYADKASADLRALYTCEINNVTYTVTVVGTIVA